jgi:hypothetical protein
MPEEAVEVIRDRAQLVAEPAPGVIGVGQERGRSGGEDRRGLVADVEDGRGCEPAAPGEDEVCRRLHSSLGLCILKKKGRRPYMRAKKMPARM